MPWLPGREELAAIWRVLGVLVQDTARLTKDLAKALVDLRALAARVTRLERRVDPGKIHRRVAGHRRRRP